MGSTVIVLGRVALDQRFWVSRFPPDASRTAAHDYCEAVGGPAGAASLSIHSLGGSPRLIAARGADAAGSRLHQALLAEGVDTHWYFPVAGGRTPVVAVLIGQDAERFMFPYPGEGLTSLAHVQHVIEVDGIDTPQAILVDSRWPEAALLLAQEGRRLGVPVVMDLDATDSVVWDVARIATHVIADEEVSKALGGEEAILEELRSMGTWGAVTLGKRGVRYGAGRIGAFQVRARDTTGAGDVFHGAFALRLAEGCEPEDALLFASAAGALRCELQEIPNRKQVETLLREGSLE